MLAAYLLVAFLAQSFAFPDTTKLASEVKSEHVNEKPVVSDVPHLQPVHHSPPAHSEPAHHPAVIPEPNHPDHTAAVHPVDHPHGQHPGAESTKHVGIDVAASPDADPATDGSRSDLETDSTLWGGWGWGGARYYRPYWGGNGYGYNPWSRSGYWGGRGYGGGWGWRGGWGGLGYGNNYYYW